MDTLIFTKFTLGAIRGPIVNQFDDYDSAVTQMEKEYKEELAKAKKNYPANQIGGDTSVDGQRTLYFGDDGHYGYRNYLKWVIINL